jgi:hypothetical protein
MLLPLIVLTPFLLAQQGPGVPQPQFQDDLLEQLTGAWMVTGTVREQPVREFLTANWTLDHQFLRIHRKQIDGPYESLMYIGYDRLSERYVAHLLDTFGARGSETLGYGIRSGSQIEFVFEYPSGPYHYTLKWDPGDKTWKWVLESKNRQGQWTVFSTQILHRARGRGPQP